MSKLNSLINRDIIVIPSGFRSFGSVGAVKSVQKYSEKDKYIFNF